MGFTNRHDVEDWLAEHTPGDGAIVEIGCGIGNGLIALNKGNQKRDVALPLFGIDPYEPYEDKLGSSYGPDTLVEMKANTADINFIHILESAALAAETWTAPISLLWIDLSMEYEPLKRVFYLWKGFVELGGVIAITGNTYGVLGTAQLAREAVASGEFDYGLHEQDYVAVLKKKPDKVKRAVFYIANRDYYVKEAKYSAASVKEKMGMETFLFCKNPFGAHPAIDNVMPLTARQHELWYVDAVRYFNEACEALKDYTQLLYLDSDTFVAYPCGEMFRLLDNYDMALGHASGRDVTSSAFKVPPSFTTHGVGVNLFRNNDKMRSFFLDWQQRYEEDWEIYDNTDEAALRDLLYERSDIRLVVLPPEYHLRFGFGCWLFGQARILHGRDPNPLEEVAKEINSAPGMRVWKNRLLWYWDKDLGDVET